MDDLPVAYSDFRDVLAPDDVDDVAIAIRLGRKIRSDCVTEKTVGDVEATRLTCRGWREPWNAGAPRT
jgi:hypothetical protein